MLRPLCIAGLALSLVGCASSDKSTDSISAHWQEAKFGAPAGSALAPSEDQAAARARILADVPARPVDLDAVVSSARVQMYERPSPASRVVGTLKQGGKVRVVEQMLWYRLPKEWYGGKWGEVDGNLPTWARVEFVQDGTPVSGFVPWRSLDQAERYAERNPADAMRAADEFAEEGLDATQKDFSRKKTRSQKRRLAGMTKGMADGVTIAANWPDFDALDEHIRVGEQRFLPSDDPSAEDYVLDFENPSLAEQFFIGRVQAGKILASQPSFPADAPISAYVRGIGDRVAKPSTMPRPYGEWIWLVVESPDLNAFALPGGFVFITTGMLDFLANEDELAAVLAHEVAHVEQGHSMDAVYRAMKGDEANDAVDDTAGLAKTGGGLLSAFGVEEGDDIQAGVETAQAIDEALGIRAAIFDGIMKGYDQASETEADARGVTLSAAAGYDPRAMQTLITRMVESGLAGPESHYSPDRRPQIVEMTSAFLASQSASGVAEATADPEAAARYRAVVADALAEIPEEPEMPAEADPEA